MSREHPQWSGRRATAAELRLINKTVRTMRARTMSIATSRRVTKLIDKLAVQHGLAPLKGGHYGVHLETGEFFV